MNRGGRSLSLASGCEPGRADTSCTQASQAALPGANSKGHKGGEQTRIGGFKKRAFNIACTSDLFTISTVCPALLDSLYFGDFVCLVGLVWFFFP